MKIAVTNTAMEAMKRRLPFETKDQWLREFILKVVEAAIKGNVRLPELGEKSTLKLDRLLTSLTQDVFAVVKNENEHLVVLTIISQQSMTMGETKKNASKVFSNDSLKSAIEKVVSTGKLATKDGAPSSTTSSSSSRSTGQPSSSSRKTKA